MNYLEMAKAALARQQAAKDSGMPSAPPAPAPETPVKDLILQYQLVLERLYLLDAMGGDADPGECRLLLQHQWKLADELGPEFVEAVDRQYRRDHGLGKWTAGTSGPPSPEIARGWPEAVPGLGPRWLGPFTSCWTCNTGTFVTYSGRPLCRACATREQQP